MPMKLAFLYLLGALIISKLQSPLEVTVIVHNFALYMHIQALVNVIRVHIA